MKHNNQEQEFDLCTRRFDQIPPKEREEILQYLASQLPAETLDRLFLGRMTMEGAKALVKDVKQ